MSSGLSQEQVSLIEENRKRALDLKQKRIQEQLQPPIKKHCTQYSSEDGFVTLPCTLADQTGQRFVVACGYNKDLISAFKKIPSRRYLGESKQWSFDFKHFNMLSGMIKKLSYRLSGLSYKEIIGCASAEHIDQDTVATDNSKDDCSSSRGDTSIKKKITAICSLISISRFEVEMNYHAASVAVFKTVPSRHYNAATRSWNFHLTDYKFLVSEFKDKVDRKEVILEVFPSMVTKALAHVISGKQTDSSSTIPQADLSALDQKMVESLFPYQRDGINFAIAKKGRVLFADDMGLGKTVQSICVAAYYREKWPLLIVCPSSVRLMWKESLLRWLSGQLENDDVNVILSGKDSVRRERPITIISYDLLTKHKQHFLSVRFQVAILDESHFIKSLKAARTQAAMSILKSCEHLLLLTGTPALSRPVELFPQLTLLRPDLFPKLNAFGERYCNAHRTAWGWNYSGNLNGKELKLILSESVMIRRTKDLVLSQLPPKIRKTVLIDVGATKLNKVDKKIYSEVKKEFTDCGLMGVEKHSRMLKYFYETSQLKSPAVVAYVSDLLESDQKFVVFAHHQSMLNAIQMQLEKKKVDFIRIDGRTDSSKRQGLVNKFQNQCTCQVAVLSITAANMGITLNSACLVLFAELFWNPGILVQAEDRCYRIGQRSVVNVHYLVAKGTSDDYVWELVKKKLDVLGSTGLNENDFRNTEHEAGTSYQPKLTDSEQRNILTYFKRVKKEGDDEKKEEEVEEKCGEVKANDDFGDDSFENNDDLLLLVAEQAEKDEELAWEDHKNNNDSNDQDEDFVVKKEKVKKYKPPFKSLS